MNGHAPNAHDLLLILGREARRDPAGFVSLAHAQALSGAGTAGLWPEELEVLNALRSPTAQQELTRVLNARPKAVDEILASLRAAHLVSGSAGARGVTYAGLERLEAYAGSRAGTALSTWITETTLRGFGPALRRLVAS